MSATRPSATDMSTALAARVDSVVPTLLPNARRAGNYWTVGSVAGEPGKSLYVLRSGPRAGWWQDSATGEHGDLLDLAGAVNGTDLRGACDWARDFMGLAAGDHDHGQRHGGVHHQVADQHQLDEDGHRRIALALGIWKSAKPATDTLVQVYLQARGITIPIPPTIRYAPSLRHGPTALDLPAMVCAVQSPDRRIKGVHRTFLTMDGTRKAQVSAPKMMLGCCAGGAVWLGPAGPKIAIAEGIETALSVQQATGLTTWAGLSTSGIRALALPAQVRGVVLCPDGDDAGEQAAQVAARRFVAEGRAVRIARPPTGLDFNDLLNRPENVVSFPCQTEAAHG